MTETEIRAALQSQLAATPAAADAAFISELFLDNFSRRVDFVMANGKLAAFEIKSERDSLARLEGQLRTYRRFFEQVTVVCAARHVQAVLASTDPDIGVWSGSPEGLLAIVRKVQTRKIRDVSTWLSFLPMDECRGLLRMHGLKTSGSREEVTARGQAIPLTVVRTFVLQFLKRRQVRIEAIAARRRRRSLDRSVAVVSPDAQLREFLARQGVAADLPAIPRKIA